MMRPGLTSITFRKLPVQEVVRLAAAAKLEGIEWGGDVHVPAGDLAAARRAAALTRDAGLVVSSYGSYYRAGHEAPNVFPRVLETAVALGAPIIRIWAGRVGSAQADQTHRDRVADDGRRAAELAAKAGLRLACEWHGNTLMDTAVSATVLFAAVAHPAFQTYWQPHQRMAFDDCLRDMDAALPRLAGIHVFHWDKQTVARLPLQDGEIVWRPYLAKAAQAGSIFALLEFVLNDDPQQMLRDTAALRSWLAAAAPVSSI